MLNHLAAKLNKDVQAHSAGIDTSTSRSKSWDEFSADGAPPLSIVITVCDSAAAEACPVFFGGKGQPVKVHWGYPDPSNAEGGDESKRRAFEHTRHAIGYKMLQLLAVSLESLSQDQLHDALQEIAHA